MGVTQYDGTVVSTPLRTHTSRERNELGLQGASDCKQVPRLSKSFLARVPQGNREARGCLYLEAPCNRGDHPTSQPHDHGTRSYLRSHSLDDTKQDVRLQAALVGFIQNDHAETKGWVLCVEVVRPILATCMVPEEGEPDIL